MEGLGSNLGNLVSSGEYSNSTSAKYKDFALGCREAECEAPLPSLLRHLQGCLDFSSCGIFHQLAWKRINCAGERELTEEKVAAIHSQPQTVLSQHLAAELAM